MTTIRQEKKKQNKEDFDEDFEDFQNHFEDTGGNTSQYGPTALTFQRLIDGSYIMNKDPAMKEFWKTYEECPEHYTEEEIEAVKKGMTNCSNPKYLKWECIRQSERRHLFLFEICKQLTRHNVNYDYFANADVYTLLELLCPDLDTDVCHNSKRNSKNLKPTNIQYHMIEVIKKLFIASLHNKAPRDEQGFPYSYDKFQTRHLRRRLEEPRKIIRELRREINSLKEENFAYDCEKAEKEVRRLKLQIEKLNKKLQLKDELIESIKKKDGRVENEEIKILKKHNDFLENQLNKTNS